LLKVIKSKVSGLAIVKNTMPATAASASPTFVKNSLLIILNPSIEMKV